MIYVNEPTLYFPMSQPPFGRNLNGSLQLTDRTNNQVRGLISGGMVASNTTLAGTVDTTTEWNSWATFSVNLWYKIIGTPTSGTYDVMFKIFNNTTGVNNGFFIMFDYNNYTPYTQPMQGTNSLKLRCVIDMHGSSTAVIEYPNTAIDGIWHMLTYTVSDTGTKYNMTMYIDGKYYFGGLTSSYHGVVGISSFMSIGGSNDGTGGCNLIQLCECSLWKNQILTGSQVAQLHARPYSILRPRKKYFYAARGGGTANTVGFFAFFNR